MSRVKSTTPAEHKDEWRTIRPLFDVLDREFQFEVDAAATADNALCDVYYDVDTLGGSLARDWIVNATHWLNPPFSQAGDFLAKASRETNHGVTTVCLVRADAVETHWFMDNVTSQARGLGRDNYKYTYRPRHEIRFLTPRVPFNRPDGTRGKQVDFPSALIVMRPWWDWNPIETPPVFWFHWKKACSMWGIPVQG